jgi:hypothetical protein
MENRGHKLIKVKEGLTTEELERIHSELGLKAKRVERSQERANYYNIHYGKTLLVLIPLALIVIMVLTFWITDPAILTVVYYVFIVILLVFIINALRLWRGVRLTERAFEIRLTYERLEGRPIDSLRGFDSINAEIRKNIRILKVNIVFSFIAFGLYLVWIYINGTGLSTPETGSQIQWAAINFTLITWGLNFFIKSLKINPNQINGLIDYFHPDNHELVIKEFFSDMFYEHLDPFTGLFWDDFKHIVAHCLTDAFRKQIKSDLEVMTTPAPASDDQNPKPLPSPGSGTPAMQIAREADMTGEIEDPADFAIEKILFLCYLEACHIISYEAVVEELKEIMILDEWVEEKVRKDKDDNDLKKVHVRKFKYSFDSGARMVTVVDGKEDDEFKEGIFGHQEIQKVFEESVRRSTPGFFKIADRLQMALRDNFNELRDDPHYIDLVAEERIYDNNKVNLIAFFFNNSPKPRKFNIQVKSTGFEPEDFSFSILAEGRGSFEIPDDRPELVGSNIDEDTVGLVYKLFEKGITLWLSLKPTKVGRHSIVVMLLDDDGNIMEGRTLMVRVDKDWSKRLYDFIGIGSIVFGLGSQMLGIFR